MCMHFYVWCIAENTVQKYTNRTHFWMKYAIPRKYICLQFLSSFGLTNFLVELENNQFAIFLLEVSNRLRHQMLSSAPASLRSCHDLAAGIRSLPAQKPVLAAPPPTPPTLTNLFIWDLVFSYLSVIVLENKYETHSRKISNGFGKNPDTWF